MDPSNRAQTTEEDEEFIVNEKFPDLEAAIGLKPDQPYDQVIKEQDGGGVRAISGSPAGIDINPGISTKQKDSVISNAKLNSSRQEERLKTKADSRRSPEASSSSKPRVFGASSSGTLEAPARSASKRLDAVLNQSLMQQHLRQRIGPFQLSYIFTGAMALTLSQYETATHDQISRDTSILAPESARMQTKGHETIVMGYNELSVTANLSEDGKSGTGANTTVPKADAVDTLKFDEEGTEHSFTCRQALADQQRSIKSPVETARDPQPATLEIITAGSSQPYQEIESDIGKAFPDRHDAHPLPGLDAVSEELASTNELKNGRKIEPYQPEKLNKSTKPESQAAIQAWLTDCDDTGSVIDPTDYQEALFDDHSELDDAQDGYPENIVRVNTNQAPTELVREQYHSEERSFTNAPEVSGRRRPSQDLQAMSEGYKIEQARLDRLNGNDNAFQDTAANHLSEEDVSIFAEATTTASDPAQEFVLNACARLGDNSSRARAGVLSYEKPEAPEHYSHSALEQDSANMLDVFKIFDHTGDNCINTADVGNVLRCLKLNPTEADIEDIVHHLSPSGDPIDQNRFKTSINPILETGKYAPAPEGELVEAFAVFDEDSSGLISVEELRFILTSFGEPFSEEELEKFFAFLERNTVDGFVRYSECVKLLTMSAKN